MIGFLESPVKFDAFSRRRNVSLFSYSKGGAEEWKGKSNNNNSQVFVYNG